MPYLLPMPGSLLLVLAVRAAALPAGDHERPLRHDGEARRYRVHVPPRGCAGPCPVVVALHGGGGSAAGAQRAYALDPVADRERFIVVYPEGRGRRVLGKTFAVWNAGPCCARADGADDTGFIAAVYIAGQLDPCALFDGGERCGGCWQRALRGAGLPAAEERVWPCTSVVAGVSRIAARNGCADERRTVWQSGAAACQAWTGCRDGAEVQLCVDPELGHHWPGGPPPQPCRRAPKGKFCRAYLDATGPLSDTIRLAESAWAFFERFRLAPSATPRPEP